jgi:hypothetical protein
MSPLSGAQFFLNYGSKNYKNNPIKNQKSIFHLNKSYWLFAIISNGIVVAVCSNLVAQYDV